MKKQFMERPQELRLHLLSLALKRKDIEIDFLRERVAELEKRLFGAVMNKLLSDIK